MVNQVLLIVEAIYLGYLFLFFFDNAINHFMYAKDVLQVEDMNKNIDSQNYNYTIDGSIIIVCKYISP